MKSKGNDEQVLLKSYKNLYILAAKQLEYIQQEDFEALAEILTQKQLIIDNITGVSTETLSMTETSINQQKLAKIITDTLSLENRSQVLMESKKPALIEKILSKKKRELILGSYGHIIAPTSFFDQKI